MNLGVVRLRADCLKARSDAYGGVRGWQENRRGFEDFVNQVDGTH